MQLSVFSTDNQKSGFRLQYMELFNWGTFDDVVHAIKPLGETSLLTGANGSGKTTFVDALLTLIVPEKKYRFYNQSSGSDKKGDRTEESYVLGGYGTMNSESSGALKTLYLRENKEEAYSILLAHFANEAEQFVTLFQVRYFINGDMRKQFAIAYKPLHIEDDFKPFDLSGNWKRSIDNRYNKGNRKQVEWFDTANKYAQRLVDALGMQSIQALQLFNQTVGIKVLGNLDEFIRTHMLEPRNIEEYFQDLKKHLGTLLNAQRNIEKVEEQMKLLLPAKEHYEKYNTLQKQIASLEHGLETARIWKNYTKNELLKDAIEEIAGAIRNIEQKLIDVNTDLNRLQEDERILKNQIDQNKAGQRLQQLEKEVQNLEDLKSKADANLNEFNSWCDEVGLHEKYPSDDASYNQIKKEAYRKSLELSTKQRNNEEDEYGAKRTIENATAHKQQIEAEINSLLQSKSNIRGFLVNLRRQLCDELSIDISDLPFSGELIQVKAEEMHWQPALEKLLHSFALRLLVPDKYYKRVNKYVNNHNLRTRLVYEHIRELVNQNPEEGMVSEKIEFQPEHKLARWVEQHIITHFDYSCTEDERTIERYDKAITLNGLIKNRSKHEKDDRPEKNDPSNYVMGWNNEKKKEALINKRNTLVAALDDATSKLASCQAKSLRIRNQFYAIKRIEEHDGFAKLDILAIQRRTHKLQEQISELRQSNDELNSLKEQLQELLNRLQEAVNRQREFIGEEALRKKEQKMLQEQKEGVQTLLSHMTETDKDVLLIFQQQNSLLVAGLSLESIEEVYRKFKEDKDKQLQEFKTFSSNEERLLDKQMQKVKNPNPSMLQKFPDWLGDVQELPEETSYAEEYIDWLNKLTNENLPKYKKDFENYINVTITYKIGGLNEELEKWERDIANSVKKLNQSLSGINFNRHPDTYIQLEKRPVASGTDIKEFRGKLWDALPEAANWQQSSFESKSLHFTQKVQPLIEDLDKNESYRSRVMDVRNWFEFWADEKYKQTAELKKTYRQMGQLSGGEKAQLTYTILCSAIAYQFGITREGKNSRSLRFIAVDESFSNQDDEKATYLMELCKELHLQLLVVTPSEKIQIVQDFIAHVHLVQRVNNRHSTLYNMTIKELKEPISAVAN